MLISLGFGAAVRTTLGLSADVGGLCPARPVSGGARLSGGDVRCEEGRCGMLQKKESHGTGDERSSAKATAPRRAPPRGSTPRRGHPSPRRASVRSTRLLACNRRSCFLSRFSYPSFWSRPVFLLGAQLLSSQAIFPRALDPASRSRYRPGGPVRPPGRPAAVPPLPV